MNDPLRYWLTENYSKFKNDLHSPFIAQFCLSAIAKSYLAIMAPHTWMYISSHEGLREHISEKYEVNTLVELPLTDFSGATVQIAAFCLKIGPTAIVNGGHIDLKEFQVCEPTMKVEALHDAPDQSLPFVFHRRVKGLAAIPGRPFAYWVTQTIKRAFLEHPKLSDCFVPK